MNILYIINDNSSNGYNTEILNFFSLLSTFSGIFVIYVLYIQLTKGNTTSRYFWLTPLFYSDTLQTLLKRSYNSLEWCINSPPKPHAFIGLPLESKVNIKLINLKEKFTLRNIFITLVSLVFAYLFKLSINYLLTLDVDTWQYILLLGFISSTVIPFFKDIFYSVFPPLYCMDGSGSVSTAEPRKVNVLKSPYEKGSLSKPGLLDPVGRLYPTPYKAKWHGSLYFSHMDVKSGAAFNTIIPVRDIHHGEKLNILGELNKLSTNELKGKLTTFEDSFCKEASKWAENEWARRYWSTKGPSQIKPAEVKNLPGLSGVSTEWQIRDNYLKENLPAEGANNPAVMLNYIDVKTAEQEYTISKLIYTKLVTICVLRGLGETVNLPEAPEPKDLSADEAGTLARELEQIRAEAQQKLHKQRLAQGQGQPWSQFLR